MTVALTRPASEFQLTRSWILKLFVTVIRSDVVEELKEAVLALNAHLRALHEYPNRYASIRSSK
jgi:hypothetical protein